MKFALEVQAAGKLQLQFSSSLNIVCLKLSQHGRDAQNHVKFEHLQLHAEKTQFAVTDRSE